MRFAISTAWIPHEQLLPIARAADELGYHSLALPDHIVDLEKIDTLYSYAKDGTRRFALTDAITPGDSRRATALGMSEAMSAPWACHHGLDASLGQKMDGMARFADDVLHPLAEEPAA